MKRLDERIQLRTSNTEKVLLKQACELAGFRNLTTFIMNTMINECRRVLKEHGNRILSARDSERVINALMNPPQPNASLKKLLEIK
jgi:uncharacterized protein (DUF1778 family)